MWDFYIRGKSIFFPNWSKSNILFVKVLFSEMGILKSPDEIIRILENKNNWICEYKINFQEIRKSIMIFHWMCTWKKIQKKFCNRDTFTTKYFYDIFLKKKIHYARYTDKVYKKKFNLTKQDWENISMNKIYRIKDKKIAYFIYKLIK